MVTRSFLFTQAALAERLAKPQSFVAKYEKGERRLDVVEFVEVAEAIDFDAVEFVRAFVDRTLNDTRA